MTGVSTVGQSLFLRNQINLLQEEMRDRNYQITSGMKDKLFSGLDGAASEYLDLRKTTSTLEEYRENITLAESRTKVMEASLKAVTEAAGAIRAEYLAQRGNLVTDPVARSTFTSVMRSHVSTINNALNAQMDGRYLFSGSDTDQIPMQDPTEVRNFPDPAEGPTMGVTLYDYAGLDANTYTALGGATAYKNTKAAMITDERAYYNGIRPVDPALEHQDRVSAFEHQVRVSDGLDIEYGMRGSDQSLQNLVSGIYAMASVDFTPPPAGTDNAAEYINFLDAAVDNVATGIDDINISLGEIGVDQIAFESYKNNHSNTIDLLEERMVDLADADQVTAITEFQTLENQLQASYQITSRLQKLRLTSFL